MSCDLYRTPSGLVDLDLLRLCQIDPPPHPARLEQGFVARNAELRFGFVSPSPDSPNLPACDIFIFAGEKSGDLHGEKLIKALLDREPHLKIAGVGGPRMREQGMQCILPMEEFQVMGFIDVFYELPKLYRHFHFLTSEILRLKPKAVITIDYPGFNLRLQRHLKKKGYQGKCIHYICPSVWAWGEGIDDIKTVACAYAGIVIADIKSHIAI